jgi:hypothetical protein
MPYRSPTDIEMEIPYEMLTGCYVALIRIFPCSFHRAEKRPEWLGYCCLSFGALAVK